MGSAVFLKVICILAGVFMLTLTVASLAQRKMNESFCLVWGIISIAIILAGILLNPTEIYRYMSGAALALILIIFFTVVYAAYFISVRISELSREKQELAIQLSIMKEEMEQIKKKLQDSNE